MGQANIVPTHSLIVFGIIYAVLYLSFDCMAALNEMVKNMFCRDGYLDNLDSSVLFRGIAPGVLLEVIGAGRWLAVEKDSYVYRQGEKAGCFYVVAKGYVELISHIGGTTQSIVSQIGPGGHFGEVALLTDSSNSLDARALSDLVLLCYSKELFDNLLLGNNSIQYRLCIALASRLRISFKDFATAWAEKNLKGKSHENLGPAFLAELHPGLLQKSSEAVDKKDRKIVGSTLSVQINRAVRQFKNNLSPVLISGEIGTGKRMLAYEIHRAGLYQNGPYLELDLLDIPSAQLEIELFGVVPDETAFSTVDHLGVFDRGAGGTVVLCNAEHMEPDLQRQFIQILKKQKFIRLAGEGEIALRSRIIFICRDSWGQQDGPNRLLPSLLKLLAKQHFRVAPLRAHRRELPQLVQYYLQRYCLQYGKNIPKVDEGTLGMIVNYDWPGNLDEMASVMQRAVVLSDNNRSLASQIILGVPRAEGKWEFNLLRLQTLKNLVTSPLYPILPRIAVGFFIFFLLAVLFFGPAEPEKNLGLVLSWEVGWPLLLFSFFFFARTWCSICGLAVPGWLAQLAIKPKRPTPRFIKHNAAWIPGCLCVLLFWVELTWNSYMSPRLTGSILLTIMAGSFIFSLLYERRVWCRYLCPLGGLNALFSMSSILELRANSYMCMNRCTDHLCYNGSSDTSGCPMFRHPFLVDNNRDCILCCNCIKNCRHQSIHLNLRLAPQELWSQRSPRLEDGFLVFSLAGIFIPFALLQNNSAFLEICYKLLYDVGLGRNQPLLFSVFFFTCIGLNLAVYALVTRITAWLTGNLWCTVARTLSYGFIPLVLAAFMAVHMELLVSGISKVSTLFMGYFGLENVYTSGRLISRDVTVVFQGLTVFGGWFASLIATNNIIQRLSTVQLDSVCLKYFPALILSIMAILYFLLM